MSDAVRELEAVLRYVRRKQRRRVFMSGVSMIGTRRAYLHEIEGYIGKRLAALRGEEEGEK